MTVTASALRELHRIHVQLSDLRDQLQRGPRRVKAAETNAAALETEFARTKEAVTKLRISADSKELQLREREERLKDLQIKLNCCGSNREYQALKEQIAADRQANSVQSDEVLEALERIDEMQISLATIEEKKSKAKEDLSALTESVAQQRVKLETELQRVSDALVRAEADLPADFKQDYQRIARARGEEALAPIDGEACSGCFQRLSAQTMNELYLSRPVFCSSCGSVLYLPEDRTPVK